MALNRPGAIDIDDEFPKATLHDIAAGLGVELAPRKSGELRMPCVFCNASNTSSYGSLVINLDHPANLFKAHCCGVKGNRLMLMYVWKRGQLPPALLWGYASPALRSALVTRSSCETTVTA